jgi:thymidylate kinase
MKFKFCEKEILKRLFKSLNKYSIQYAVMRNYDSLPDTLDGSDLDIIVSKLYLSKFFRILNDVIESSNCYIFGKTELPSFTKVYILSNKILLNENITAFCIDINHGFNYKGIDLLCDGNDWPIIVYNDICCFEPKFACFIGTIKNILNNSEMNHKYLPSSIDYISSLDDSQYSLFNNNIIFLRLLRFILINYQINSFSCILLNFVLKFTNFIKSPISIYRYFLYIINKFQRFTEPSGLMITFCGVDGSGKSTVIKHVSKILSKSSHNDLHNYHLRPFILPHLSIGSNNNSSPQNNIHPHSLPPSFFLISILRILYITLDYLLGYWIKLRKLICRSPAVIIFDRYSFDLLIDPKRFRINLPDSILKLFYFVTPKPTINFILHCNHNIVLERKKELSVNEIIIQNNLLLKLSSSNNYSYVIDSSQEVNKIISDIFSILHCIRK